MANITPKQFELWSKVDSLGRKIIWTDSDYRIAVNCYSNPTVFRLYGKAIYGEKKVGEMVCSNKSFFGENYLVLKYIKLEPHHIKDGYEFRLINSLLSILSDDIKGLITNYKNRSNPKPVQRLFEELGGYKNSFGYMEILNPKRNRI